MSENRIVRLYLINSGAAIDFMVHRFLGEEVIDWEIPPVPDNLLLKGKHVSLAPLSAELHTKELFESFRQDREDRIWDYLPYGPFEELHQLENWVQLNEALPDPYFLAIEKLDIGTVCGVASYLRIKPKDGSIEVGHINFSPLLQKSIAATEAMYLMMKWVFDSGYRRYEWKCNALNAGSRKAAQRLGFSYEGIFRQATISKGRNRDTAWFAIIDKEWERLNSCFNTYLNPGNFKEDGTQEISLSNLTREVLVATDPMFE